MDLFERLVFLSIGGGLGFILGFIVARLRDIEKKVETVDEHVKTNQRVRDEGGFMRIPLVSDVLYLLVLIIVVWGAFAAQQASNKVEKTQDDLAEITSCNQEYLAETIQALNERTTYTQEQAFANVDLQRAQAELLRVLREEPPPSELRSDEAFDKYFQVLSDFLEVNTKTRLKQNEYPYPTTADYESCLDEN